MLLDVPAAPAIPEQESRIALVAGEDFLAAALRIGREAGGLRLSGWISRPVFSRSQADLQFFYLNGRAIRDKLVASSLEVARSPEFQDFSKSNDFTIDAKGPEETKAEITALGASFAALVKELDLK